MIRLLLVMKTGLKLTILLILISTFGSQAKALEYRDKNLSLSDKFRHQGYAFAGLLAGYGLTQWDTIKNEGSFSDYEDRFLEFRFDQDNSTWNLIGHPLTGSQTYLFYRALGHSKKSSLVMSFFSSLAFEVLIETYTENPSIQDTFQTPLFGAVVGNLLEKASLKLINSPSRFNRFIGRVINPFSFLAERNQNQYMTFNIRPNQGYSVSWVMNI